MNAMLHHQDAYREGIERHQQEAREWAYRDQLARLAKTGRAATADGDRYGLPLSAMQRLQRRLGQLWTSLARQVPGWMPGARPASRPETDAEPAPRATEHLTLLLREKRLRRSTDEPGPSSASRTTVAIGRGRTIRGPRSTLLPRSSLAHGPARRRSAEAARTRSRDD